MRQEFLGRLGRGLRNWFNEEARREQLPRAWSALLARFKKKHEPPNQSLSPSSGGAKPRDLSKPEQAALRSQDFRGKYMLIYFGFTHCPDTCPAELQVMTAALDQLGNKADKVLPIFVTVDPERDTPGVLDRLGRIILRHPGSFRSLICGEV
jgi:cytochrome oxidase Cu insertion factor (SCO1/SenC/PrrC family)